MRITRQQQETLRMKWKQNPDGRTFLQFRRSAVPELGYGYDPAIAVRWCSMWLCIEDDGYCHT